MFAQAQMTDLKAYSRDRDHSRGRSAAPSGDKGGPSSYHPLIKKNPSSPSKIFKQYMPNQGNQRAFGGAGAQHQAHSKSPFRNEAMVKELGLFGHDRGNGDSHQQQRDHSEATSTSMGGPAQTSHAMPNLSPAKASLSKYCGDQKAEAPAGNPGITEYNETIKNGNGNTIQNVH